MYFLLRLFLGMIALALFLLLFSHSDKATASAYSTTYSKDLLAKGKYLIQVGACNDCHTLGYAEAAGDIPESEWLVGAAVGFSGPWGTSYPINLRNMVARMDEDEWIDQVKTAQALPPMPWFNLHAMTREDLRAMYAFIHELGPKGEEAPAPLSPGVTPSTPYIEFVPKFPNGGTK